MAVFALPWIEPENYDAFQHLMGTRIPDTYDEWLYLHTQQSVHYVARGHKVKTHEVRRDDFAEFCRSHGYGHDTRALQLLAADILTNK
jgi:hypothetical protein